MALLATPSKARSVGVKRQPGRLFLGYFLLATQKKVTRPRVREPDSNNVAAATQIQKINLTELFTDKQAFPSQATR
jgi:hypothetical protein